MGHYNLPASYYTYQDKYGRGYNEFYEYDLSRVKNPDRTTKELNDVLPEIISEINEKVERENNLWDDKSVENKNNQE